MASLDLIVDVQTSVATSGLQVGGFGVPMVAAYFTSPSWVELYRSYEDLDAVVADGFAVTSPVYKGVAAVLSQSPTVSKVGVGRRTHFSTNRVVVTPVAANLSTYSLEVVGTTGAVHQVSFVSDSSATVAEICTGLAAAINAAAAGVVATDGVTSVSVVATVAGQYFSVSVVSASRKLMSTEQTHSDPGIALDLAAIEAENDEWYGFTLVDDQGSATIVAAAAWALGAKKMYFQASQDSAIKTSGSADVLSVVGATTNKYASVMHSARAGTECAGAAILGVLFSSDPGSLVLAGKSLAGITPDQLTSTEIGYIKAKHGLYYTTYGSSATGSVSMLETGCMTSGLWADVVRDMDWFSAMVQVDQVTALSSNAKLPYTDAGSAVLAGVMRSTMMAAEAAGVFAPGWTVTMPKVSSMSSADKAARIYRPIKYSAVLAGAIQSVSVRGTVTQ